MTEQERMARPLAEVDPEVYRAVREEMMRQNSRLELIASENFTSEAVLEAAGSVLTNKYAEGYPGKRYYGGCEFVDIAENLARDRAKALFGAEYANVQPHSGAQANMAAYHGRAAAGRHDAGHESGARRAPHPRASAEFLRQDLQDCPVRRAARGRNDRLRRTGAPGRRAQAQADHRGRQRLSAHASISRVSRQIADSVGAMLMVDMAHISGLVAAGLHPNPCEYADIVTSTTHKTLRGPRVGHDSGAREIRAGNR